MFLLLQVSFRCTDVKRGHKVDMTEKPYLRAAVSLGKLYATSQWHGMLWNCSLHSAEGVENAAPYTFRMEAVFNSK